MRLQQALELVLPKDRIFFALFTNAGQNLREMGSLTLDYITETAPDIHEKIYQNIEDLEHANDDVTHDLFRQLGNNFITPFDRADIHTLAGTLDDVADFIYATIRNVHMHNLDVSDNGFRQLAEVIKKSTADIANVVSELRKVKNPRLLIESLVRVNRLESHAEDIFDAAIHELFIRETDFKQLILKREIFVLMEQTTMKCRDVAQTLKMIIVKSA